MNRARLVAIVLALLALVVAAPAGADIPPAPSGRIRPIDEHTAKKTHDKALQLFKDGAYAEALVQFENAYKLWGRASSLKKIAECHRFLKHFVDAYDAFDQLFRNYDSKQVPWWEKRNAKQALDELALLIGTLTITVNEAGAEVEIDGKSAGTSPLPKPRRVEVGPHKIRVVKSGFDPFEASVAVAQGDQNKIDVVLGTEPRLGRLVVREKSGRAVRVFVDGEEKGAAPWDGDLVAGEHTIEARGAGLASSPRKAMIVAKELLELTLETQTLDASLPPPVTQPLVPAEPAATPSYRGLYLSLSVAPYFPLKGQTSNLARGVALHNVDREVLGGGATLRAGYAFGWFSLEIVGAFLLERRAETQRVPQPIVGATTRIEDESLAPNGFFGLGPRVTTKHPFVRFTFGVAPGVVMKNYSLERSLVLEPLPPGAPPPPSQDFSAGYFGFGLQGEAGLLFGRTPGPKFFVGIHGWFDLPPANIVVGPETVSPLPNSTFRSRGRGLLVASEAQIYIGPVIGIRFGK